jgi:ribosomal protein S4E
MSKIYLTAPCPVCGKRMFLNSHGYQCEGCTFHIPSFICNRRMTPQEVEKILSGEDIILDGFSSNAGKVFSSIPVIVGHEIKLDNTVYTSPVLGRVIVGTKGFMCATEDGQQRSKLRVQRIYNGHPVTADEVKVLLHDGNVAIDTFDDEGNPQQQTLSFDMRTQRVSFHL